MAEDVLFGDQPETIVKTAELSADGVYRYDLTRRWGSSGLLTFVMLNPSTADADVDDPTIRRCMGFARRDGFGGIRVVNLYALRTTRPVHLWEHADPVGPENDLTISDALDRAAFADMPVVCAWGANARPDRVAWFRELAAEDQPVDLVALRVTKAGAPGHPLYLPASAPLKPWSPR